MQPAQMVCMPRERQRAFLVERAHLGGERRRRLFKLGKRNQQREQRRRRRKWLGGAQPFDRASLACSCYVLFR
jgi:hypothetical protein